MSKVLATLSALVLGAALLAPGPARADEEDAEVCLRAKVWDGYSQGWAIRTMTSTTLSSGDTRNYLVTLYKGNEYKIQACGDDGVSDLDVLLYDLEGKVIARDEDEGVEPSFTYTPEATRTYYVVVYAQALTDPSAEAGAGLAVTYK